MISHTTFPLCPPCHKTTKPILFNCGFSLLFPGQKRKSPNNEFICDDSEFDNHLGDECGDVILGGKIFVRDSALSWNI